MTAAERARYCAVFFIRGEKEKDDGSEARYDGPRYGYLSFEVVGEDYSVPVIIYGIEEHLELQEGSPSRDG